jgi:hypothetical protein
MTRINDYGIAIPAVVRVEIASPASVVVIIVDGVVVDVIVTVFAHNSSLGRPEVWPSLAFGAIHLEAGPLGTLKERDHHIVRVLILETGIRDGPTPRKSEQQCRGPADPLQPSYGAHA